jgi:hypothetical protein
MTSPISHSDNVRLSFHRLYRDQLILTESHLDSLLASANDTLKLLSNLSNSFKAVEMQTTAFQGQCEDLLNDQKRTTKLADDISENLRFYTYLEPITRRLNAPGAGNFVRSKEYSEMLSNLDACLDYMQAHVCLRDTIVEVITNICIAKSEGFRHISFAVSSASHSSFDLDSRAFYKLAPRCSGRRVETNSRQTTQ